MKLCRPNEKFKNVLALLLMTAKLYDFKRSVLTSTEFFKLEIAVSVGERRSANIRTTFSRMFTGNLPWRSSWALIPQKCHRFMKCGTI